MSFVQRECFECHKKIFDSEDDARRNAKRFRKEVGPKTRPYLGKCGYWHTGHMRSKKRRQEIARKFYGK